MISGSLGDGGDPDAPRLMAVRRELPTGRPRSRDVRYARAVRPELAPFVPGSERSRSMAWLASLRESV